MNVFELTTQYRDLEALLESGTLTIEDATARLTELDDAFEQKIENIGFAIKNREAALGGMETAADALARRMESTVREIDALKALLIHLFNLRGAKKIKFPYFAVTVSTNQPSVVVKDESAIPAEYWREIPPVEASRAVDKIKIKEDAKEGVIIPGVELVATQKVTIK